MSRIPFWLQIFVLYAFLFPWIPALHSPNEVSRLMQARAIVDHHTVGLNEEMARWGGVGDLAQKDGRLYPNKAPGVSFAGAPVYAALRLARGGADRVTERAGIFFLRLLCVMLPAAFAAECLRRILALRMSAAGARAGATVFALGTIYWPYSTFLMSHGPVAACLVCCWYGLFRARAATDPTRLYALAGFAAGCAVLVEYTGAILLPPLAVYGFVTARHKKSAVATALAAGLPPILLLAAYHTAAYGSPWRTGYAYLVNRTFAQWHSRGFEGVGAPSLRALAGSFFDSARGLFVWCPWLLLGVPGLATLWKRDRADALLCASALLLYGWFTASFTYEAWGWCVGPRHITPLCAFLALPAASFAEWLAAHRAGFVAMALGAWSIANMALAVAVCPYIPEELTNPLHQLVLPLLARGLHSHDLLSLALHTAGPWTLVPWAALLAYFVANALLGWARPKSRALDGGLALASACALFVAAGFYGGPDVFDHTRSFMLERFEPAPGHAPGIFDPP